MTENRPFLGRGWAFPPEFAKFSNGGETLMVEQVEDIEQSLTILLNTTLGERVMQPTYGCNMADYVFESMNPTTLGFLQDLVFNAILYHEPRIRLENLEINPSNGPEMLEGKLVFNIEYTIRETNSRFNFVFDFYLKEGTIRI